MITNLTLRYSFLLLLFLVKIQNNFVCFHFYTCTVVVFTPYYPSYFMLSHPTPSQIIPHHS